MQSSRVRLMLVALLGVFAFSAVAAAAAQAEEAPFWSREGTRLAKGETHYITAKKYKNFRLGTGLKVITCENIRLKEGVLLGSNAGEAGTNNEVIEFFEGCKVEGKVGTKTIEKCKVKEPITTVPVKSELVETVKGETGSLLTEFFPEKGEKFTVIQFEVEAGGFCPPETAVEGSVAGQVRVDPNKPPELGELVSLPNGKKEAKSWLLNFPAAQIKTAWLIKSGGEGKEVKLGLKSLTEEATLEGTALILLAKKNSSGGFESEEVNWSPLP